MSTSNCRVDSQERGIVLHMTSLDINQLLTTDSRKSGPRPDSALHN